MKGLDYMFFDTEENNLKIQNDRKGKTVVKISTDYDTSVFIVEKNDKPEFVDFLKAVIKELQKT